MSDDKNPSEVSLLTIEAPAPAPDEITVPVSGTKEASKGLGKRIHQLLGKQHELKARVATLEAQVSDLAGRNEALEARHAEDREQIEELLARLASFDRAENELRQSAEVHMKQALARFDACSASVRQRFTDFNAVIESKPELRQDLLRAVVEMSSGPTVLYFLVKSPDFCRQVNSLPLGAALEQIFVFVQKTEQSLLSSSITQTYLQLAKPAKEHHVRS